MSDRSVSVETITLEPLDLSEAKEHLGITATDTTHDDHVSSLITAARELWEHDTQTLTTQRAVTEDLRDWPDEKWRFHYRPVVSITSVKYYDSSNVQQTLASTVYSLDAPNRRLLLDVDQTWPDIETRWDAIEIIYEAGQGTVDEMAKSCMKLKVDVLFELRGMTKDKNGAARAYDHLVERFLRSSYP